MKTVGCSLLIDCGRAGVNEDQCEMQTKSREKTFLSINATALHLVFSIINFLSSVRAVTVNRTI